VTEVRPEKPPRNPAVRLARKIAVGVGGVALIIAGVAMLVLPGPGVVAIFAGLALLATEFEAARKVNDWAKERAGRQWRRVRAKMSRNANQSD
jgi:uncharacterized protein (TIGR02611 family)